MLGNLAKDSAQAFAAALTGLNPAVHPTTAEPERPPKAPKLELGKCGRPSDSSHFGGRNQGQGQGNKQGRKGGQDLSSGNCSGQVGDQTGNSAPDPQAELSLVGLPAAGGQWTHPGALQGGGEVQGAGQGQVHGGPDPCCTVEHPLPDPLALPSDSEHRCQSAGECAGQRLADTGERMVVSEVGCGQPSSTEALACGRFLLRRS